MKKETDLTKNDPTHDQRIKNPKACFLYYMVFSNSAILYREARAVQEKGYEVDIIDISKKKQSYHYEKFHGLNLFHIQSRPSTEKHYLQYFSRIFLFFIKATIILSYLGFKKRYAFIHVTTPPDFMVFATIIPKIIGAKIILDIHDIGPELFMRKLNIKEGHIICKILKIIEKYSAKYADHVITVTDLWKEKLEKRSVNKDKCSVLLNVPDDNLFKVSSAAKIEYNKKLNLFYHGSLEEHFGVDTLIKAMPKIKDKIPNIYLQIYGSGRILNELNDLIARFELDNSVKINNKVPFYELPPILKKASIGIVPTKSEIFSDEALSMKSLEYIAMNIPIVISNTRAHKYYFNENMVTFFNAGDQDDLANAVIRLCSNKSRRDNQVRSSHEFYHKYGWPETKKIYYKIIDKIFSEPS